MKLIFKLLLSGGFLLANLNGFCQLVPGALGYHEQALMFSNYNYIGSARIQGLANTQISLGGDISSALSNPAGLGFYNRSEFSFTPSYNIQSASSNYFANSTNNELGNFNLANLGVVFNKSKDDIIPGKWRGGSFAISFSKINNFNSEIRYSGQNPNNDLLDFYVQDANNQDVSFDQLEGVTYGAYVTYLMSEFIDVFVEGIDTSYLFFYDRTFFSEFPRNDSPTTQEEMISTTGGQNQWNFSYGGNYNDFLYFGATLGIQSLRYNVVKQFSETYSGREIVSSSLTEDLLTEGIGVNGTFGIIARPINQLTIGLSLITPTYLSLSERYTFATTADYNNFNMTNFGDYFDDNYEDIVNPEFENSNSPYYPASFTTFYEDNSTLTGEVYDDEETIFDYTLTTPLRLNFGTTFFINKNGFISADIEYVDYSSMKIKDDNNLLVGENSSIKQFYQSTISMRVGGEWRLNKLRLRAGYNFQPSPINMGEISSEVQLFSVGLGYRSPKFFTDLAVNYKQFNSFYSPYLLENPDGNSYLETSSVDISNTNLNFALSIGFFF